MKWFIGEYYKHIGQDQQFKLTETNGVIFRFECGHWCTDNVFEDMVRVRTGLQVFEDTQIELF